MRPPETSFPFSKFRLSPEVKRRIRTRSAYLDMSMTEYITHLVENDTDDMFERIDKPKVRNGGR